MPESNVTPYDRVPYASHPFTQCHPDRLATVATLLGMHPPAVDRCRVLELACASGGNLIPMAVSLPKSTFLGIDLSSIQVAEGQQTIQSLQLKNIELRHLSILDVGPEFGVFDYVISHGVYSWVPANVQQKILEICAEHLTPNGVAYVSYNTYPGWHMRGMIRDMMGYYARQFTEPQVRVNQARNLLDFLAKSVAPENSAFSLLLKSEVQALQGCGDYYLFHEHLEEHNEPIYFHQFIEQARAKGLQYLGEADINVMVPANFRPEVEEVLQKLSADIVQMEQYMDFVRNRMFRQTLLCHKTITPNYKLNPEQMTKFLVASPAEPVSPKPDIRSTEVERFRTPEGITLSSSDPLVKSAMVYLSEIFPRAVPFDKLRYTARQRLSSIPVRDPAVVARDTHNLGHSLLTFYASVSTRLIELHVHEPNFTLEVSKAPYASPLARYQANNGKVVTNLRHEMVGLEEFDRHLLMRLDGSRNRAALLDDLVELVRKETLVVEDDGKKVTDEASVKRIVSKAVDQQLPWLARNALLVS